MGHLVRWRAPRPVLRAVIRRYSNHFGVRLDEAADPIESFATFNAFFTRALADGQRTIDPRPDSLVSPVDGKLLECGDIRDGRLVQAKGIDYGLDALIADGALARRFREGSFATLYLSPGDYHRIHAPVGGSITGYRYSPGRLYPVNNLAVRSIPGLFARNERLTTVIETESGHAMAVVKVGASNVGSIELAYDDVRSDKLVRSGLSTDYATPMPVAAGDEVGRFNMGSTVILLAESGLVEFDNGLIGSAVQLGQRIGRMG